MSGPASILLLADDNPAHAATVLDHIRAFSRWSRHEVHHFNPTGLQDSRLLDLDEFDAVVIHYSIILLSDYYLAPALREKVRRFQGLKIQFVQDDYRGIETLASAMQEMGIHVLYTALPDEARRIVWSDERLPGVLKVPTLTGYVPEALAGRSVPPVAGRPFAVGYRAREFPLWMGRVAQERVTIAREFLARARPLGITCDIRWDEAGRLYGDEWIRFHLACRSTLGTESAISIVDFDGRVERAVREFQAARPQSSAEDIEREVLAPFEGNVIARVVSPRVFEAAALGTPMILFRGGYSGVVSPWTHYVPLEPDFSNFDEVVARLGDVRFLQRLADSARQDLVSSGHYSYREMVRGFDELVDSHCAPGPPRAKVRLGLARLARSESARGVNDAVGRLRTAALLVPLALGRSFLDPQLRRLWRLGLTAPRAHRPRPDRLAADLLRLALLIRAARSPGSIFVLEPHWDPEARCLSLVSVKGAAAPRSMMLLPRPGAAPAAIVWDHRAIGTDFRLGRGGLALPVGSRGVYPFEALQTMAAAYPDDVWDVLLRVAPGRPSDSR